MGLKEKIMKIAESAGVNGSKLNFNEIDDNIAKYRKINLISVELNYNYETNSLRNISVSYCVREKRTESLIYYNSDIYKK